MVYGLVYDQNPLHVPPHPLGIPYIALTCDRDLSIVNQQHQPV